MSPPADIVLIIKTIILHKSLTESPRAPINKETVDTWTVHNYACSVSQPWLTDY